MGKKRFAMAQEAIDFLAKSGIHTQRESAKTGTGRLHIQHPNQAGSLGIWGAIDYLTGTQSGETPAVVVHEL